MEMVVERTSISSAILAVSWSTEPAQFWWQIRSTIVSCAGPEAQAVGRSFSVDMVQDVGSTSSIGLLLWLLLQLLQAAAGSGCSSLMLATTVSCSCPAGKSEQGSSVERLLIADAGLQVWHPPCLAAGGLEYV